MQKKAEILPLQKASAGRLSVEFSLTPYSGQILRGGIVCYEPVGTIFLYIITPKGNISRKEIFSGNAEEIVLKAADRAAALIQKKIS